LVQALAAVIVPTDLAGLPPNDLASAPPAVVLLEQGAFRADVTGAGPVLYGLFEDATVAAAAVTALSARGWTCLTAPAGDR
jgi:shikimate kinase